MQNFSNYILFKENSYQDSFLDSIITRPLDPANYLVYADWLEENGNQRLSDLIRHAFAHHNEKPGSAAHGYQELRDSFVNELKQQGWYFRWSANVVVKLLPEFWGQDLSMDNNHDITQEMMTTAYRIDRTVLIQFPVGAQHYDQKKIIKKSSNIKDEDAKLAITILLVNNVFKSSYEDRRRISYGKPQDNVINYHLDSTLKNLAHVEEYAHRGMSQYDFEILDDVYAFIKQIPVSYPNGRNTHSLSMVQKSLETILSRIPPENCRVGNRNYCNTIKQTISMIKKILAVPAPKDFQEWLVIKELISTGDRSQTS